MPNQDSKLLRECAFCGSEPEYSTFGSHIEIGCCVFMSRQKSDYLTINERMTYDAETMLYSGAAEEKAFNAVAIEWNRRAPSAVEQELRECLRDVMDVVLIGPELRNRARALLAKKQ